MARPLAPCGTMGAYQRHKRLKKPVDEACVTAARKYWDDQRARKGQQPRRSQPTSIEPEAPTPKVRCPICDALEPVEHPFDAVAGRMSLVRHFGKSDACAREMRRRMSRGARSEAMT